MCSAAKNVLCARSSFVGIFPPLSRASISLAYTIFSAYLTFLSKTKINENFSFQGDWSGRDKFAILSIFFRRYRSTEITRIKIIFQIVDGEIRRCWDPSLELCCVLCCEHRADIKNGKQQRTSETRKGQIFVLSSWRVSRIPAPLPAFHRHPTSIVARTVHDIFPTWKQTAYLTNCTQANLYGENYYLTSIHYNASCLVFGWYFQTNERASERANSHKKNSTLRVNK